jgi:hypothetical protein
MKQTILERIKAPTPKFFRKLRNIALFVGAVATGLATGGISHTVMGSISLVAGTLATASQLVTTNEEEECTPSNK